MRRGESISRNCKTADADALQDICGTVYGKDYIMKKKFKLEDLDCANCAAKMEEAIKKIEGVNDANVSFLAQKMTIDADDGQFDEIMKKVVKVCEKVEPDCRILM